MCLCLGMFKSRKGILVSYILTHQNTSIWYQSRAIGRPLSTLVISSKTTGQIYFWFGQKDSCDSHIWICYYNTNWSFLGAKINLPVKKTNPRDKIFGLKSLICHNNWMLLNHLWWTIQGHHCPLVFFVFFLLLVAWQ